MVLNQESPEPSRSPSLPSAGPVDDVLPENGIALPCDERGRSPVGAAVGGEGDAAPLAVVPASQQWIAADRHRHSGVRPWREPVVAEEDGPAFGQIGGQGVAR